jgi:hypothetical protein
MSLTQQLANATVNAEADAVTALLNNGYIQIYDGIQPANANTAIANNNLLAQLQFANPAFGAPVNGVTAANAIASAVAAVSGTASWFRLLMSDGSTVVMDGSVGTANCNMNLNSVAIQAAATVSISAFTFSASES